MRLIDADKLKQEFKNDSGIGKALNLLIDAQPTVCNKEIDDFSKLLISRLNWAIPVKDFVSMENLINEVAEEFKKETKS